jgi:hypothetical protein
MDNIIVMKFVDNKDAKGYDFVDSIDKPKSHIYFDRTWYLKLYHFTLFIYFLVQLVDLV